MENSLWKRLWTRRKTDCGKNELSGMYKLICEVSGSHRSVGEVSGLVQGYVLLTGNCLLTFSPRFQTKQSILFFDCYTLRIEAHLFPTCQ